MKTETTIETLRAEYRAARIACAAAEGPDYDAATRALDDARLALKRACHRTGVDF